MSNNEDSGSKILIWRCRHMAVHLRSYVSLAHVWWSLRFILGEGYPRNATSGHLRPSYCIHWKVWCQNSGKNTRLVGWWWDIEKLCQIVILGYGSSSWGGGGGGIPRTDMGTRRIKSLLKCFPMKCWLHKHLNILSLLGYEEWLKLYVHLYFWIVKKHVRGSGTPPPPPIYGMMNHPTPL